MFTYERVDTIVLTQRESTSPSTYFSPFVLSVRRTGERALFVRSDGSPLKLPALRDGITKATQRELGIKILPHQFRHLAAKIVLDAHPGALGMVKELLGHKSFKTTANAYAGLRTREAGREYDKLLTGHRTPAGESRS